ncbi:MAG TPA: sterol desaturase family protein [Bryobacteraceae bacterium]|nr:sterol desaturase family protein [Bryobacteraceae bacterium]
MRSIQHLPFAIDIVRLCVWLALLMAIFVPLERFFALHRQRIFRKAFATDLVYYFLSGLVPNLLLLAPMSVAAWALHSFAPSGMYARMGAMPVWARFAAAMIVGEVGSYWGHRWMHQVPMLWRFHAIHHSAEEIDWLVNTRAHPVDLAFTRMCAFLPMYLLGLAQPMAGTLDLVPVLITLAGTVWGFFIHANVKWRFGKLEWLISSPAFHHWHHTNDGPETINKNFAPMLPWVDRCFGTFYLPRKEWPGKYGTDAPMAAGLGGQLLSPLGYQD